MTGSEEKIDYRFRTIFGKLPRSPFPIRNQSHALKKYVLKKTCTERSRFVSLVIPSFKAAAASPRRFLYPSALFVLIADLIPAAGILFWGWDAFVLLMLYWMETAVIAFWTLARILVLPDEGKTRRSVLARVGGRLFLTAFFLVHSSAFMAGHLLFLWTLYAGDWRGVIHGPHDFWRVIVLGYDLWIPLGLLFVGLGLSFFWGLFRQLSGGRSNSDGGMDQLLAGLYGRIALMHVVIIFGVWVAAMIGSKGPYLLLIALKTVYDLVMHVSADLGRAPQVVTA
jgi:hypothetical protein